MKRCGNVFLISDSVSLSLLQQCQFFRTDFTDRKRLHLFIRTRLSRRCVSSCNVGTRNRSRRTVIKDSIMMCTLIRATINLCICLSVCLLSRWHLVVITYQVRVAIDSYKNKPPVLYHVNIPLVGDARKYLNKRLQTFLNT